MNTLFTLLVPAALLFAAPTDGARPEGKRGEKIQRLDTDGNGSLSAKEVAGTRLAEHFAEIDANADGQLTKAELQAAHKARKGEHGKGGKGGHVKKLDKDGNGSLSAEEVAGTRLADRFAEIDANGDGQLTKAEMKAAHEARRAEHEGKGKSKGKGKSQGKGKGEGSSR